MLPRDLKKYQDFLKEPQQYGEPQLRGGARDWLQRNAQTAAAFQTALASGMTVAEAEQAVLQQAQSWHLDISQGDIAAIPLQTQVTPGWSTRDLKRHYYYYWLTAWVWREVLRVFSLCSLTDLSFKPTLDRPAAVFASPDGAV